MNRIYGVLAGAIVAASQGAPAFSNPTAVETVGPRIEIPQGNAQTASGFDAALAGELTHPSDLLDYADTLALATALMGDERDDIIQALYGPGSIERRGNVFIGDTCRADNCWSLQVLIVVDVTQRRLFLAWQNRAVEVIRPSEYLWPMEGQDVLVGWRNAK